MRQVGDCHLRSHLIRHVEKGFIADGSGQVVGPWGETMINAVARFLADEEGLETVEYAVMLGLIAVGAIAAIATMLMWVGDHFAEANGRISAATTE